MTASTRWCANWTTWPRSSRPSRSSHDDGGARASALDVGPRPGGPRRRGGVLERARGAARVSSPSRAGGRVRDGAGPRGRDGRAVLPRRDDGHALLGGARERTGGARLRPGPQCAARRARRGLRRAPPGSAMPSVARDDRDRAAGRATRGGAPKDGHAGGGHPRGVLHDGPRRGVMVRAGLAEPVLGSQQIFRAVLDAMAHPGRIVSVPPPLDTPAPLWSATASMCLTLVDGETPVWL